MRSGDVMNIPERAQASAGLCAFVRESAPKHEASADAPNDWPTLRDWFAERQRFGKLTPFRVFNGGCDKTIYPDAATNHAFRAWHDYIHCENQYGFNREHEIKVGLVHMQRARAAGLPQSDLDMLIADTIGQVEYYYRNRAYVDDQARFVSAVLRDGLKTVLDSGVTY